jgi:hypothetical protein
LPIPIASRVSPDVFCTSFRVPDLILRSLIHFELILLQGDKHGSSFSFLQVDNHFSQKHLLKMLSIFHHMFLTFVKNKVDIAVWIHIPVFSSVLLVFMSVFVPVPCMLFLLLLLCNIV